MVERFSLSASFLGDPFLVCIVQTLERYGESLSLQPPIVRIVGGAVRNSLLGLPVRDIDLATRTTPEETVQALSAQQLKTIPTGLAHGTVRVLASTPPGEIASCEITTLRCDTETFGRRARVAYTQDWRTDALRRDFTLNALYLDLEGQGYDYTEGLSDLRAGRLRFIGVPEQRIREDFLRILRLFRIYAQYPQLIPDEASYRACACERVHKGLANLSGERIREELLGLLGGTGVGAALRLLARSRALDALECAIDLPEESIARLERMVAFEESLGENVRDAERGLVFFVSETLSEHSAALSARLKLSGKQSRRLQRLCQWARAL